MKTLVLSRFETRDSLLMAEAAEQAGWNTTRLSDDLTCPEIEGEVLVYGDGLTARIVAEKYGLNLISPSKDWLLQLKPEHVLRDIQTCLYKDLLAPDIAKFIKCSDTKWFYPGVFCYSKPTSDEIPEDELLLIQEPVEFLYEFRYFVLDNEIRTYCQYKRMGVPSSDPAGGWVTDTWFEQEARRFLIDFLRLNKVIEAVVIDVGFIAKRGWAIIEANPAYASGIYDCNPRQVLEVVERACNG